MPTMPTMRKDLVRLSKFLSLLLRHKPETVGLELDGAGWAQIDDLLAKINATGQSLSRDDLLEIVESNNKRRFAISEDGQRIRASQGHSTAVDLDLEALEPPVQLFHGTATRFLAAIREQGLIAGERQHVHLSADVETARQVGQRHGKPVVLTVDAAGMFADGFSFYRSANGVWLTASVPPRYLSHT